MAINSINLFVIFVQNDVLFTLVEFENDLMNPRESVKNGQIGAHGLNSKISVNFELIFAIYGENYFMKKISCLPDYFEIFVTQPGRSLRLGPQCKNHNFKRCMRILNFFL